MDLHHGVVAHQQWVQLGRHRAGIGGAALLVEASEEVQQPRRAGGHDHVNAPPQEHI